MSRVGGNLTPPRHCFGRRNNTIVLKLQTMLPPFLKCIGAEKLCSALTPGPQSGGKSTSEIPQAIPCGYNFPQLIFSAIGVMRSNKSLSTIFKYFQPPFSRALNPLSHLRPVSQLAAFDHPIYKPQPFTARFQHHSAQPRHPIPLIVTRQQSSAAAPSTPPLSTQKPSSPGESLPGYEISLTCKPCRHRSTHKISKQGYHHGTVLITCPDCKNRHVISDHLKIFADQSFTIEDIMRKKGNKVTRGSLDGNVEYWDDGTKVERSKYEKHILKLSTSLGEGATQGSK